MYGRYGQYAPKEPGRLSYYSDADRAEILTFISTGGKVADGLPGCLDSACKGCRDAKELTICYFCDDRILRESDREPALFGLSVCSDCRSKTEAPYQSYKPVHKTPTLKFDKQGTAWTDTYWSFLNRDDQERVAEQLRDFAARVLEYYDPKNWDFSHTKGLHTKQKPPEVLIQLAHSTFAFKAELFGKRITMRGMPGPIKYDRPYPEDRTRCYKAIRKALQDFATLIGLPKLRVELRETMPLDYCG